MADVLRVVCVWLFNKLAFNGADFTKGDAKQAAYCSVTLSQAD